MLDISIGNPPIAENALGIWYAPISGEPDPAKLEFVRAQNLKAWKIVPSRRDADPIQFAKMILAEAPKDIPIYVLIPGKKFDRTGTRHGHGGGWYDRFLSQLPRTWIRVGVATEKTLSSETLKREAWDEPMDWLVMGS